MFGEPSSGLVIHYGVCVWFFFFFLFFFAVYHLHIFLQEKFQNRWETVPVSYMSQGEQIPSPHSLETRICQETSVGPIRYSAQDGSLGVHGKYLAFIPGAVGSGGGDESWGVLTWLLWCWSIVWGSRLLASLVPCPTILLADSLSDPLSWMFVFCLHWS